ncbi:hypothetical protein CDAR_105441 [Caerostris darwini]|uniref:G-protein coupled receptors family 1 profile domain-containing protein n=1 Tax=Caerostris darwini TaxID=1538125 RepID=A0AAV4N0X3_9ARAC|nr:hypothetical protein CDAR_105441 [Caerostris darwini]
MSILSLVGFLSSVHTYLVTVAMLFRVSTTGAGVLKRERSGETTSKELSTVLLVSWCLLPMTVVPLYFFFGGHNQPALSICFGIRSWRNQMEFFPRALCLPLG